MVNKNPFKCFKNFPKITRLAVMFYVRYPLSYRQVEDILHERGIDICHETVLFWVGRFGLKFANEIRKKRAGHHSNWQWRLDEVFVKVNGERFYLWRAIDHEGEVLECYVSKRRDRHAAKKFLIKTMRKHGSPKIITTDKLATYRAHIELLAIRSAKDRLLAAVQAGYFDVTVTELATRINLTHEDCYRALRGLYGDGRMITVGRGRYGLS